MPTSATARRRHLRRCLRLANVEAQNLLANGRPPCRRWRRRQRRRQQRGQDDIYVHTRNIVIFRSTDILVACDGTRYAIGTAHAGGRYILEHAGRYSAAFRTCAQ